MCQVVFCQGLDTLSHGELWAREEFKLAGGGKDGSMSILFRELTGLILKLGLGQEQVTYMKPEEVFTGFRTNQEVKIQNLCETGRR